MIEPEQPPWNSHPVPNSLVVQSVVRPKRVAILFDRAKATLAEIDAAILIASECWGGAYWPLIPFSEAGLGPKWWSLLEAADPDIICALHDLPKPLHQQIVRRCAPMRILEPRLDPVRRPGTSFVWSKRIGAVSTAGIPRVIYAEQRLAPKSLRFLVLEDTRVDSSANAFALRNFGALTKHVGYSRSFDELPHEWLDGGLKTPIELIGDFAKGDSITPRDLARFRAERAFRLEYSTESRAFWLVVGDSPMDVALAWNSAVVQQEHLGRSCLWLSKSDATDTALLAEIRTWIGRNFYSQGSAEGLVLSYSESSESLETTCSALKGSIRFSCRTLGVDDSLLGDYGRQVRPPSQSVRLQQVSMRGDIGRVEFLRPTFARQTENGHGWMVDLEIEHPRDPSISSWNLAVWKAPRKAGVAAAFSGSQRAVRINWNRTPSFEILDTDSDVRFRFPAVGSVFSRCFFSTESTQAGDLVAAKAPAFHLTTSDAGLQLRGVLGLFGGLWQAGNTFENPFWRDLVTQLSGRPEDMRARQVRSVYEVLVAAAKDWNWQIVESAVPQLAERVAEKAWRSEPAAHRIELDSLGSKFASFVAKWVKDHADQSSFQSGEKFAQNAQNDLGNLIEIGVLLQGASLRCRECFTEFWLHVDDLRRSTPCPGCLASVRLPPNPAWSVKVNELVSSALRQRGVLPVLHALYELQQGAHAETFTFIASQDVLNEPFGQRVTDLDLLVLLDGRLLIGEVKANARGFDEAAINGIMTVARAVLPDRVLFAAEADGSDWPEDVRTRLDQAASELATLGVSARRHLLQWRM